MVVMRQFSGITLHIRRDEYPTAVPISSICSGRRAATRVFRRAAAVSYTHLDVYKRQVSRSVFLSVNAESGTISANSHTSL